MSKEKNILKASGKTVDPICNSADRPKPDEQKATDCRQWTGWTADITPNKLKKKNTF